MTDRNPLVVIAQLMTNAQNKRKRKRHRQALKKEMPEEEWRDLYFCKSLDELSKHCNLKNIEKLKTSNEKTSFQRLEMLYNSFRDAKRLKDMEKAYIHLFRYVEMYVYLEKLQGIDRKFIKAMYGKKVLDSIEELESLKKKLTVRYKEMKDDRGMKKSSNLDKDTDDIEEKRLKKSDSVRTQELITNKTNNILKENSSSNGKTISCSELLRYSKENKEVLIIDVRSSEAFESSKIKLSSVSIINLPKEIIVHGESANKITEKIKDEDANKLWRKRKSFDLIVIVDDDIDVTKPPEPTRWLMRTMIEFDTPGFYKNQPKLLEGGQEAWLHKYPTYCTNAGRFMLKSNPANGLIYIPIPFLDDIKYPELEEPASVHKATKFTSLPPAPIHQSEGTTNPSITSLPPSEPTLSQQIPTINRQTKPSIGKKDQNQPKPDDTKQNGDGVPTSDQGDTTNTLAENESLLSLRKSSTNSILVDRSMNSIHVDRSTKPERRETRTIGDKDNSNLIQKKSSLSNDVNKSNNDITYYDLNTENSSSSSSSMKRSTSFPNLSNVGKDDEEESFGSTPPKFDRNAKPKPLQSPYHNDTGTVRANAKHGLTGLKNLGNTCYMNSILQCVSNTIELKNEFCAFDSKASASDTKKTREVAREVMKVVRKLWAGQHKQFSCDELKKVVGKKKASFRGYEQQDSHEFFTVLMEWLHDDLNEPNTAISLDGACAESGELALGEFKKRNDSIVMSLFYGQLKSTVTCVICHKQSVTFEPFSNLSLLLPNHSETCTLNECIELYLKEESISGWNCPSCKQPRPATKKIDITRLPPVLVMHLKRFTSSGWCRKKQTMVDFPLEALDMAAYALPSTRGEQRNRVYDLYAVSNHYGTMESGHYTAYCHNADMKKWYKFDDTEVIEMQATNVRTPAAYILFYRAVQR